jgi:hypothetical protein
MQHLGHSEPRSGSRLVRLPPRMPLCTLRIFRRNRYPLRNRPHLPGTKSLQGMQHLGHSGLWSESKGDRLLPHKQQCTAGRSRRNRYPLRNHPHLPGTKSFQGMQHLGHSELRSESKGDRLLPHKQQCTAGRSRRNRYPLRNHPHLADTQQAVDTPRLGHSVPPSPSRFCCSPVRTRWYKPPRFRYSRRLEPAQSATRAAAEKPPLDFQ